MSLANMTNGLYDKITFSKRSLWFWNSAIFITKEINNLINQNHQEVKINEIRF